MCFEVIEVDFCFQRVVRYELCHVYHELGIVDFFIFRSFGVFMWEIFSDGEEPYKGITDLIQFLAVENKRLRKLVGCRDNQLFELISSCWEIESKKRYC